MKTYLKPDVEMVKFASETIADGTIIGGGDGGSTSNVISGDGSDFG